jgi:hypothetical protein
MSGLTVDRKARYKVIKVTLDKWHPLWPNAVLYKVKDQELQRISWAAYTTKEVAAEKVANLNKGIGRIS